MSRTYRSRAIVISHGDFGEADKYVHFLTQQWGVISTLARSARKSKRRYVGGLDLFCHDEICVRGDPHGRPYLMELSVLNSFSSLRENLDRLLAAGKATQWVKKLANVATPMPQVYSLLGQCLALMEKESEQSRLQLLSLLFKVRLLSLLGLKPQIQNCIRCNEQTASRIFFDVAAGGVLCESCLDKNSTREYFALRKEGQLFLSSADQLRLRAWEAFSFPEDQAKQLHHVITQFASYHTHLRLPV